MLHQRAFAYEKAWLSSKEKPPLPTPSRKHHQKQAKGCFLLRQCSAAYTDEILNIIARLEGLGGDRCELLIASITHTMLKLPDQGLQKLQA